MLYAIVILGERDPSVVWRINVDALNLSGKLLFQGLQREQVVSEDQTVVKDILLTEAVCCMIGKISVLQ
jgi:hypothetical protein